MLKLLFPAALLVLSLLQISSGLAAAAQSSPASITVDFGSRSGTEISIAPGMLAAQYLESIPDAASRKVVVDAGFKSSRQHANIPLVYATPTPAWNRIDSSIRNLQALGVHPIVEIDGTPPWLQPSPLKCKASPTTSVPMDLQKWGALAASYVAHFDKTFPGVVQDYEIWNEPNTAALCGDSTTRLNDYLAIYAAAAPLMKQAHAACTSCGPIHVGGPVTAGVTFQSLLTDPRTAPYVDFYSYHVYLASPVQIRAGMTWDGAGGTPSLLALTMNSYAGEQGRYLQALAAVKAGKTPLGAKMPVYFTEYNDDWSFAPDCCRNSPIYSPLFNSLVVARVLNSVYPYPIGASASQVPSKMVYYASENKPFCLLGTANVAMDCARPATSASSAPYPQFYTYKLISARNYLGLVDGGHMARSVTMSQAANSQGLVVTGFYTPTSDSILIINPTKSSFAGVTMQINNSGLPSPTSTLYTLNQSNPTINSRPLVLAGSQATFDVPPYSVLAVTLK